MKTIVSKNSTDRELKEILDQCRFTPRYGVRKFGPRLAVEVSGRNSLRAKFGDIRLRIVPLVPVTSTPSELLETVRDTQRELTNDLNRGIAHRAAGELDRLLSDPLSPEALRNCHICLHQDDQAQISTTDEDGEAHFTDVELDRECSFSLAEAPAAVTPPSKIIHVVFTVQRLTRSDYERAYGPASAAAAPKLRFACESAPSPHFTPTEKKCYSHIEDGATIEATLIPTEDGKTLLEIGSDSRRLKNAPVHYQIAGIEGELRFQSHEGLQKASTRLEIDYATAIASDPEFQVFWITD